MCICFLTANLLKFKQFDTMEHENSTLLYCWKTQIPNVPSHLSLVTIHQPVWDTSLLLNLLLSISFKSPPKISDSHRLKLYHFII